MIRTAAAASAPRWTRSGEAVRAAVSEMVGGHRRGRGSRDEPPIHQRRRGRRSVGEGRARVRFPVAEGGAAPSPGRRRRRLPRHPVRTPPPRRQAPPPSLPAATDSTTSKGGEWNRRR